MKAMIDTVAQWIDEAKRVVVLTGAGISTDSGIPDFRGPQGVWTRNPEAENRLRNATAAPTSRAGAQLAMMALPWKSGIDW